MQAKNPGLRTGAEGTCGTGWDRFAGRRQLFLLPVVTGTGSRGHSPGSRGNGSMMGPLAFTLGWEWDGKFPHAFDARRERELEKSTLG